jgi:hypothetical protein
VKPTDLLSALEKNSILKFLEQHANFEAIIITKKFVGVWSSTTGMSTKYLISLKEIVKGWNGKIMPRLGPAAAAVSMESLAKEPLLARY